MSNIPETEVKEKPFKRIMVELNNGLIVDIAELPKEHYEYFLELTHQIRLAYITLRTRK